MKKILILALLLSFPAFAKEVSKPFNADHPIYIDTHALAETVPPPPKPGSQTDEKDLTELETIQKNRTNSQCLAMKKQAIPSVEFLFPSYPFSASKEVENIFWKIRSDAVIAVETAKNKYKRQRPFVRDGKRFRPCYEEKHGKSYPSGHAAIASLLGLVLAQVDPGHAVQYDKEAKEAAWNRVIGGVHHPSDIHEGMLFGKRIHEAMLKSAKFQKDIVQLKKLLPKK